MSAPMLPVELYRPIILDEALNLHDLYSLSLTARALSSEAYTALYRRVELRTSHETNFAIRTFIESDRVVQMVRELLLRPRAAFRVEFAVATPLMIRAIHRMSNLRALTLGYLWIANPFSEVHHMPHSAVPLPGADASIPSNLGATQPEPPGLGRTAWTRGLKIPSIETLTIEANTYYPIRDLFGALPMPLPHLVCIRPFHIRHIGGIRRLSCERVYGQIVSQGEGDSQEGLLSALEHLNIVNWDSYPTQSNWAPRLATVSLIVGGGRGGESFPSQLFDYMKFVKRVGPVYCKQISEDFLQDMSKLGQLEGLVLKLSRIGYRDFGVSDIERMKRATPHLLWVALVPDNKKHPGVFMEYTKWAMREEVEGDQGHKRWVKIQREIEDWGVTLPMLLGVA